MPLSDADIKLLESERLADSPDGGGRVTANEIVDGVINNLFPDISSLDRTAGRVNLRKAFLAADTATVETYYGAHLVVTRLPADPRVHICMFDTDDHADERDAAQNFIESYLVAGPQARMHLWDDQPAGARQILVVQQLDAPLPEIGAALALSTEAGATDGEVQFVRIASVDSYEQTFSTTACGSFKRRVVTLGLTGPLTYTFYGASPTCRADHGAFTIVRTTSAADLAHYYTARPLAADADIADISVYADTVYHQLVPGTQAESPVADVSVGRQSNLIATGHAEFEEDNTYVSGSLSEGVTFRTRHPVLPGTYRYYSSAANPNPTFTDPNGDGVLIDYADGATVVGSIDYGLGEVTVLDAAGYGNYGNPKHLYRPAIAITEAGPTLLIAVDEQNRQYNYTALLSPIPAPGTCRVDYMALGKWYTLTDSGAGSLADSSGAGGSGSINFATGSLIATLGALPDASSAIIISWSAPTRYEVRTENVAPPTNPPWTFTLADAPVIPGTVTLEFDYGASGHASADDTTEDGLIKDGGTTVARIVYATGEVAIDVENNYPLTVGSSIEVGYSHSDLHAESFNPTPAAGIVTLTLPDAPIKPGTIKLDWSVFYTLAARYERPAKTEWIAVSAYDDGNGTLWFKTNRNLHDAELAGVSINYTTGEITFPVNVAATVMVPVYGTQYVPDGLGGNELTSWGLLRYDRTGVTFVFPDAGLISAKYMADVATPTVAAESIPVPSIKFNLTPWTTEPIVPGSVSFTLSKNYDHNEMYYADTGAGILYNELDHDTRAANPAGTIDYASGEVEITDWYSSNFPALVELIGLLTRNNTDNLITTANFRTPGAPLRPSGLYIQATDAHGTLLNGSADLSGVITGDKMAGEVDVQTGIVTLAFGELVAAAGLTAEELAESWYDADNIDGGGNIWRPSAVAADTLRYTAVVYFTLPLNPTLLGLDPVRLPQDGRVPCFRPGDVTVVMQTDTLVMPNPLVNSQIVALPEAALAKVQILDTDGDIVDPAAYTADLVAGQVQMAADWEGSHEGDYTYPLTAYYRYEDMLLATDVEINGRITLNGGLTHAYDEGDALVASALPFGDLYARAHHVFSQKTWTSVWSDGLIGDGTTAQYDLTSYPIELLNEGATKERWAVIFTSTTAFNVAGEKAGIIASGDTSTDLTVVNPITGNDYFTLRAAGWGAGWAINNCLRFNTDAAAAPGWFARTTEPGPVTADDDAFAVEGRGDAD